MVQTSPHTRQLAGLPVLGREVFDPDGRVCGRDVVGVLPLLEFDLVLFLRLFGASSLRLHRMRYLLYLQNISLHQYYISS